MADNSLAGCAFELEVPPIVYVLWRIVAHTQVGVGSGERGHRAFIIAGSLPANDCHLLQCLNGSEILRRHKGGKASAEYRVTSKPPTGRVDQVERLRQLGEESRGGMKKSAARLALGNR